MVHQIYEPLFILDADGVLQNWLCESYEYQDDTHLVIHLREGVQFSNGTPLTANDVLWSFQRIVENSLPPISQIIDLDIDACEVVDDNTLILATNALRAPCSTAWPTPAWASPARLPMTSLAATG